MLQKYNFFLKEYRLALTRFLKRLKKFSVVVSILKNLPVFIKQGYTNNQNIIEGKIFFYNLFRTNSDTYI